MNMRHPASSPSGDLERDAVRVADLWDRVHAAAQQSFAALEAELRRRFSHRQLEAVPGRTHGSNFLLFTYRNFSLKEGLPEPVTVGITFRPLGNEVSIEADASGEQTGDIVFSVPPETVPLAEEALIAHAKSFGRELQGAVDEIAAAMLDPLRGVR